MTTLGKNLGGVHTLDDLKARCEEVGECWEWQGGLQNHGRCPTVSFRGRSINARRVALTLHRGEELGALVVVSTCGNRKCVNPEHLIAMPKSKAMRRIAPLAISPARNARVAAAKQARSKVTPDMVRIIRLGDERADVLSAQMGVSKSTILAIRRGERHTHVGNPWAGLMRGAGA